MKVRTLLLFASLISLLAPHTAKAQIKVASVPFHVMADSIVMVKGTNDSVAFAFPRKVAIEYLNIRRDLLPAKNRQLDEMKLHVATLEGKVENQNQEIVRLGEQRGNDQLAIARMDSTLRNNDEVIAKQIRRINRFKFYTYVLGAAAAGLVVLSLTR